jgi:hypothetical protein
MVVCTGLFRITGLIWGVLVTRAMKTSRGHQYVGSSILLHFIAYSVTCGHIKVTLHLAAAAVNRSRVGDPPPVSSHDRTDQGRTLKKGTLGERGETVDTAALEAAAERHTGSSPVAPITLTMRLSDAKDWVSNPHLPR